MVVEQRMESVSEAEALDLAATVPVGRIVYSRYALPAVFIVNFKLDGRDPVFHTRKGPMFGAGVAETVVAFEVDRIDEAVSGGWSVLLRGPAHVVGDDELVPLPADDVQPWAGGTRDLYIRITPTVITGRRIHTM